MFGTQNIFAREFYSYLMRRLYELMNRAQINWSPIIELKIFKIFGDVHC